MDWLAIIGLIIVWFSLKGIIEKLEFRITKLEEGNVSGVAKSPTRVKNLGDIPPLPSGYQPMYSENASVSRATYEKTGIEEFAAWLKQDFMVKLGAFLLIIALGWFVTYAIDSNWIGPVGQITLGLLTGIFFLGLGVWRIDKFTHQGGIFAILGGTIILVTVFAGREVYNLFTPISALSLIFFTVVLMAFISVRYRSESLIYAGLIMASIAPLMILDDSTTTVTDLFSYLLIVTLGSLWVVWITGWTRIILVSLVSVYLYSVLMLANSIGTSEEDIVLMFSFVFVSIYFIANMVSLVRRHSEGTKHMLNHVLTALGTVIFLLTWIESSLDQEWKSLIYVVWALIFAVGTYVVYSYTANKKAFYLYGATSIGLIGIATASELEGPVLTLAFLFEICLLVFAASRLKSSTKTITTLSQLLAIPFLLSLDSLDSYRWADSIFHEHFIVIAFMTSVLAIVGLFLKGLVTDKDSAYTKRVSTTLLIIAGLYAVALVWLTLHAIIDDGLATTLSLVLYTISGITLFVSGTNSGSRVIRLSGGFLVGAVIARLLLVDIQYMELAGRIITFAIIGVLLISTAFIKKTHKDNEPQA